MFKRRPKALRFETRGQRRERNKRSVLLFTVAFLVTVATGMIVTLMWPSDSREHDEVLDAVSLDADLPKGQLPASRPQPTSRNPPPASQTWADPAQPYMDLCQEGPRTTCVVDGDTIWLRGENIRVADIDTPEVSQSRCDYEYSLGMQATYRLRDLLNEGRWSLQPIGDRDEDQYGRKLRVLTRDGRSIGDILVAEGLARTWTGRREPWC